MQGGPELTEITYPQDLKRVILITRLNCKLPTWNLRKALQLSNQMCLETLEFLAQNVFTLW